MSHSDAGQRQLERLRELGLRVRLLPTLRDVDTPADAEVVADLVPGSRFGRLHTRLLRTVLPLELYDEALSLSGTQVRAITPHEELLDIGRWQGPADEIDRSVLARCEAPVLDVGCGPGRLAAELLA